MPKSIEELNARVMFLLSIVSKWIGVYRDSDLRDVWFCTRGRERADSLEAALKRLPPEEVEKFLVWCVVDVEGSGVLGTSKVLRWRLAQALREFYQENGFVDQASPQINPDLFSAMRERIIEINVKDAKGLRAEMFKLLTTRSLKYALVVKLNHYLDREDSVVLSLPKAVRANVVNYINDLATMDGDEFSMVFKVAADIACKEKGSNTDWFLGSKVQSLRYSIAHVLANQLSLGKSIEFAVKRKSEEHLEAFGAWSLKLFFDNTLARQVATIEVLLAEIDELLIHHNSSSTRLACLPRSASAL